MQVGPNVPRLAMRTPNPCGRVRFLPGLPGRLHESTASDGEHNGHRPGFVDGPHNYLRMDWISAVAQLVEQTVDNR